MRKRERETQKSFPFLFYLPSALENVRPLIDFARPLGKIVRPLAILLVCYAISLVRWRVSSSAMPCRSSANEFAHPLINFAHPLPDSVRPLSNSRVRYTVCRHFLWIYPIHFAVGLYQLTVTIYHLTFTKL